MNSLTRSFPPSATFYCFTVKRRRRFHIILSFICRHHQRECFTISSSSSSSSAVCALSVVILSSSQVLLLLLLLQINIRRISFSKCCPLPQSQRLLRSLHGCWWSTAPQTDRVMHGLMNEMSVRMKTWIKPTSPQKPVNDRWSLLDKRWRVTRHWRSY